MFTSTTGLVVLLAVLLGVGLIGVMGAPSANSGGDSSTCGAGSTPNGTYNPASVTGMVGGLSDDQLNNARTIAGVAIAAKLGRIGVRIAIVTAYTESTLVSVNYGDIQNGSMTSSRGLFQQMDPWGPLDVRLDPAGATSLFINGGQGGQSGLLDIPNWWTLDPWVAAQAVEQSEFSDGSNYRGNLEVTDAIVDQLLTGQTVPDLPDASITAGTTPIPAGSGQGSNVMVSGAAPATPAAGAPVCGTVPGATPGTANPATGLAQNSSQDPSSFGWVRAANQVPFSWQGHNFGEVAAGTEPLWTGLLNDLVPQIPGGLNSNLGCFENRNNVNSPSMVSFHAYGLACDINYDANPNGASPARSVRAVRDPDRGRAVRGREMGHGMGRGLGRHPRSDAFRDPPVPAADRFPGHRDGERPDHAGGHIQCGASSRGQLMTDPKRTAVGWFCASRGPAQQEGLLR